MHYQLAEELIARPECWAKSGTISKGRALGRLASVSSGVDWDPGGVTTKKAWHPILFGQSKEEMIYYWVGSQLIGLGRKSTHFLVRSGPVFLGWKSTNC